MADEARLPLMRGQIMARIAADGDGHGAVSYTHLRAHETVLDLVCRLLLEKKKTQNTNANQKMSTQDRTINR